MATAALSSSTYRIPADQNDIDAWEALASDLAKNKPLEEETRGVFELLVSAFPTSARFWKLYADKLISANKLDECRRVFRRCLLTCPYVGLWSSYIQFLGKISDLSCKDGREQMKQGFEFALSRIGNDIGSGWLWTDYITFLNSAPANDDKERSGRMMEVRKTYQQCVRIPTHHIERLWNDYQLFENSDDPFLTKSLLSDHQPKFISAREVYREKAKLCSSIDYNMLSVLPRTNDKAFRNKQAEQLSAWKRLITFEKRNPQRIPSDSAKARVSLAYEQSLMYLYHNPDMWYQYAMWCFNSGEDKDSCCTIFERGLKAVPDCHDLKYAFAQFQERRGEIEGAKKIYEGLLSSNTGSSWVSSCVQFMRFLRRTHGREAAGKFFLEARGNPNCTHHVYSAYASMVFCLDKDTKLAGRVFESGMGKFRGEPDYIRVYADFLTSKLNDDKNGRVLFERALSVIPPQNSAEVWKLYLDLEKRFGDLGSLLNIEQRMKTALSSSDDCSEDEEPSLKDVMSRYSPEVDVSEGNSTENNSTPHSKYSPKAEAMIATNSSSSSGSSSINKRKDRGGSNSEEELTGRKRLPMDAFRIRRMQKLTAQSQKCSVLLAH